MESLFVSESVTIKCRVKECQLSLLRKNYKSHLKTKHPSENCLDLTPFGQNRISAMFRKVDPPVSDEVPPSDFLPNKEVLGVVSDTMAVQSSHDHVQVELESVETGLSRKRNASGDSGVNEDEEMFETPLKKVNIDNKHDKSKYEEILSEIKALRADIKRNCSNTEPVASEYEINQSETGADDAQNEVLKLIAHARSMNELQKLGFKYDGKSCMFCIVCNMTGAPPGAGGSSGAFAYSCSHGLEFEDEYLLPQEFRHLKYSLKRHVRVSKSHASSVKSELEKEKEDRIIVSKNQAAGMNLGFICMKNYILGRPYTDFETDVQLLKKAGSMVGELNHSRKFPAAFRPSVRKVVNERVKKYFSTPLTCTGHLPPVAVSADKATFKHRSRQFLSVATVNPGGKNLIEIISCGAPVVTSGSSGPDLVQNMKSGFDNYNLQSSQIESGVFDGVYFHCSIEENFNRAYNLQPGDVHYSWDGLHKSGLVDSHMCKKQGF